MEHNIAAEELLLPEEVREKMRTRSKERMTTEEREKLIQAVREYNAAENSLRRAHDELKEAIPLGMTVLHKRPGETGDDLAYWTYHRWADGSNIGEGAGKEADYDQRTAVIIEAPARREEFLPRLGDCT